MGSHAPVAVVVVSWNSSRFLPDCLESLLALSRPPAEIFVFDNASTDGSAELVRERFPTVRLHASDDNVGFCRANNVGIASTTSPFVLALNPDTRLEPEFLDRLLPAFDDPAVGLAAGKLLRFDGRTIDSAGQLLGLTRQPVDRGYDTPDDGRFDRDDEVFGACGAAALYRREMLESIADDGSYFDERFFAFYEDLDLAWRARKLGWRAAYRHRAVGFHARGGSAEQPTTGRMAAMLGRSPEVRFHVVKNRYLCLLRNESAGGYLAHLPFIWARDLATLGLLALRSPGVLGRLWSARGLLGEAWKLRKLDAARPKHKVRLREGS
ncbi:MAG: glycosyltransferase family 2 protein [bacterium]|nr:glycosyltransferase family 2 protein [bacterium]